MPFFVYMEVFKVNFADTIAAISTPAGTGGIGIVRISGSNARQVADRVFKSKSGKKIADAAGYTALYGHITDKGQVIDEGIALVFAAPASYTGEDVVELSVHGGVYIVKTVLRAVLSCGARLAGPGEFTRQAFLNHKLDLTQAEAVMELISSGGESQRRAAMAVREGAVSKKVAEIRDFLIRAAGNLAAYTDYPDEDIPELRPEVFAADIRTAAGMLEKLLRDYDAGRIMREGVDAVIAGRPNVGKSTLMNLLAGDSRSIVCDVAGTTRDIIEESVMVGSVKLKLSDTAGLRDTDDPVESIGVELTKKRMDSAQLIIAVIDGSAALEADDLRLLESCRGRSALVVINKSDLPLAADLDVIKKSGLPFVIMSASAPESLQLFADKLEQITGIRELDENAVVLAGERQRSCAATALSSLDEALEALSAGFTLDAVGVCLDEALEQLLSLTGERVTDAVADDVFSRFCVGK